MANLEDTILDNKKLNQPIMGDSSYNMRMKEEQQQRQMQEKVIKINETRKKFDYESQGALHYVELMNSIESLLHACGAEPKANFVDVSRDFMKILTRIPMKANLHHYMADDDKNNPRFHKVVTQILIGTPQILGVRWVPIEDGTMLILSIRRD